MKRKNRKIRRNFPAAWHKLAEDMRKRNRAERKIKAAGGNKFEQLQAKLTDNNGKLLEDIVIYAIRTIDDVSEARDFYKGYADDIEKNPSKYPKQAKSEPEVYAKEDTYLALNLHFYDPNTHKLWEEALKF